jgi:3-methyladenine DNA glycosylase Mpg
MGIGPDLNRADLTKAGKTSAGLWIEDRGLAAGRIVWTPRIGIRVGTDRLWRCCLAGHPAVSGKRAVVG